MMTLTVPMAVANFHASVVRNKSGDGAASKSTSREKMRSIFANNSTTALPRHHRMPLSAPCTSQTVSVENENEIWSERQNREHWPVEFNDARFIVIGAVEGQRGDSGACVASLSEVTHPSATSKKVRCSKMDNHCRTVQHNTIATSMLPVPIRTTKRCLAPNLKQSSSRISFLSGAMSPLSLLILLELGSLIGSGQQLSKQQEFIREMSDLLTVAPAFAPTRRPSSASARRHQSLAQSGSTAHAAATAPDSQASSERAGRSSPARSSKFVRTNELDAFLDDMNHNELRSIASGQPIEDLFAAKPVVSSMAGEHGERLDSSTRKATGNATDPMGDNFEHERQSAPKAGLVGSHSEQQIYSECALILQRTYVKNIDDPKHQLVPFGKTEQACISYKHIDKAIEQAKHKLRFREFAKMRKKPLATGPGKPPLAPLDVIHSTLEPPEDLIAAIGEINMATTQIIADQFDLSNDELLNGLPLIDMSKTKFWHICPLLVKQELKCELTRFRTFTAHCNNLKHPTWGAAMTPFARYLPPVHPDGIWIPRKSVVSEVTFNLGEGHREMHSSIAPSMPLPVFNGDDASSAALLAELHGARVPSAHVQVHHRHQHARVQAHTHFKPAASALDSGAARRPSLLPVPVPPMAPIGSPFSDELAAAAGEPLEQAGSVQFARRAPPLDAPAGADEQPTLEESLDSLERYNSLEQRQPLAHYQISQSSVNSRATHFEPPPPPAAAATPFQHQTLATAPSLMVAHKSSHSVAQELPSARLVTSIVHQDVDVPAHDLTILFMSWGQLLDHDMTRAAQPPSSIKCCPQADGSPPSKHKLCLPIEVPESDPFYSKFGVRCLEFRRSLAGVRPNCVLGPRVHQNAITSPIDANFVYGSSQAMASGLRLFRGGRLRDRDWFRHEGLKPLLPAQDIEPDVECIARPRDLFCFLAGDVRANEQTHLTVLHTLYMREHNRLADKLAELNPHWDDERIYHETRHIVAAGVQHVLINEYIPLLIGHKMSELYNLTAQSAGHDQRAYWQGHDPSVTTSVSNSFAAAAFRQGHTFVQGTVERYNKYHEFVAAEKLRHLFKQPFLLYQPGVLDELTSGMINQPSQQYDPFISADISGHLFQPPELKFGHDLAAINLQRGREQGLPGYNLFREWCGLPRAETFEQLEPYLTNRTAYHYSRLYKHVDDIDLWSGGVSERKLQGAAIGPTFACIIARQFSNTRRGDRFWYENPGFPSSFTPDQLAELRKITLARILCANSDDLPTIQRWAFRMAHPVLNPRVDCNQLPEIDLQYWQEE